ncbi:hypothetical protein [Nocardia caishijiensis]|uniref:CYTH domain-containing protein n=1 Tax=Nocardia caishijiensis TaxID=184756 RepID=A0ABQ6YRS2_9NOCA|nr:hypothetical protein [Nocardia caishijiensis]KAF0848270.1 hypothetical protein FNL39_102418 [Nocardia caishijiensis]
MRKRTRHLRLRLAGRLDQAGLETLRATLRLSRVGRLTDREDAEFGVREVRLAEGRAAQLELWRIEQDQWSIYLDTSADTELTSAEISHWQELAEEAARAVGFDVVERRVFHAQRPSVATETRNEDWLRTMRWDLPARTLPELWSVLQVTTASDDEKREALRKFMASPTWEPAPTGLREEAEAFLAHDQSR